MRYLAVDDLVAPRATLDLIWAGGRGFGRVDHAAARPGPALLDPGASPYQGGWPHPPASRPAACEKTLTAGIPENGEDNRE
jgi:hypothetical protein